MIRTADVEAINNQLEIVQLNGQRFEVEQGYCVPTGFTFRHPEKGYLGFKDKPGIPYRPLGGQAALKEILEAGGFLSFEDCMWIQEMSAK